MRRYIKIFLSVLAVLPSFSSSAQVDRIDYEDWKEMPRLFPQVLMFTAEWCQPSEAMMTSFNKLALEYAGRVQFYYVDYDENTEWASQWNVPVLPTTYFIYESDIATDGYKWMAQKSVLSYSFLRDKINWLLSSWTLKNLPEPVPYKDKDDNTPMIEIMSAALNGDVDSQLFLADSPPYRLSTMWYYLAAQNDHPDGLYQMAQRLNGYSASIQQAADYMIKAADKGSKYAIDYLIDAYRYGIEPFEKDYRKVDYYRDLRAQLGNQ